MPKPGRGMVLSALLCSAIAAAEPLMFREVFRFPDPLGRGHGRNSYVLRQGAPDGPCIAHTWAVDYEDGMVAFYNADLELVGTWRDEGGEMPMNVTDGDLDGDGVAEVLVVTRWNNPGAHVLEWNPDTQALTPRWSYVRDTDDRYHRGSAIGDFTAHPGGEVVFGNSKGELLLLDKDGNLLANETLPGKKTIQRIEIVDSDGDGLDEMIIGTGRRPGLVHLVSWNTDLTLNEHWRTDMTPDGVGGDNCYEVAFHPNGHPDGGPAIAATSEEETPDYKGSVALLDMDGKILWQDEFPEEDGRAGGVGFGDLTGDGIPEIVTRSTGPHRMVVYDNKGNRIATDDQIPTSSAGPQIVQFRDDLPAYIVSVGTVYRVAE